MGTRRAAAAGSDSLMTGDGEERSSDVEDPMMVAVGDVIDSRYRVERVLGSGAMGMVVLAEHVDLKEKRAIKLMHRRSLGDARAVERFVREARASASVASPFITRVFDLGRLPDGIPFIVMEALDGWDLRELLERRGSFELDETIGMMLQVLSGLAEAHDKRIVHRDLKPSNLFVVRRASRTIVKILDFGIAKVRGGSGEVTTDSDVLGSPLYMAPEQVRSTKDVDARADIWSMGTILYRCLTGRNAFSGDTVADIMVDVLTTEPAPLRSINPAVPAALDELVIACLAKPARERPEGARALSKALLAAVPADVAERARTWLDIDADEAASGSEPRNAAGARGPDSVATARATKTSGPATLTVAPARRDAAPARTLDSTQISTVREVDPQLERTVEGEPPSEVAASVTEPGIEPPRGRRRALPFVAAAAVGAGVLTAVYLGSRSSAGPLDAGANAGLAVASTDPTARSTAPEARPAQVDRELPEALPIALDSASGSPTTERSAPISPSSGAPRARAGVPTAPVANSASVSPASTPTESATARPAVPSDPTRIRK
ncbi:MAG: protein kinase [Polyangiaceae bacterium]